MPDSIPPAPCRGPSRRALLSAGLLGAFGLGLDEVLRLRALSAESGTSAHGNGQVRGKGKPASSILIWLVGGPSHPDTVDPKPAAPGDVLVESKPICNAAAGS